MEAAARPWSSRFRSRLLLGGLLALSSCAASGRHGDRAQTRVHVLAPTYDLEREIARQVDALLPQIAAAFGDPELGTVIVAAVPDRDSEQARPPYATSRWNGIILYDTDPDSVPGHLGHELVHLVTHFRISSWNTLPVVLEEGLCCLVGYGLTGASEVEIHGYLPRILVEHFVNMSLRDLHAQELEDSQATGRCGTYLAGLLGFDRLEALTRRAHVAGHDVVPTAWILEAVDEAERLRPLDRSGSPTLSLDPLFGRIEAFVPRTKTVRLSARFDVPDQLLDAAPSERAP